MHRDTVSQVVESERAVDGQIGWVEWMHAVCALVLDRVRDLLSQGAL